MKIIIVGSSAVDKYAIAKKLQAINDDLAIAPVCTTMPAQKGKLSEEFTYYMSDEEVELSYRNGAFMWVRTDDDGSRGVTKPDMYTSSLFVMSYAEFSNMSNPVLKEFLNDGGIICWIDSKSHSKEDLAESEFACGRICECPYLYFLDEDADYVSSILMQYMGGTDEERAKIADELNN